MRNVRHRIALLSLLAAASLAAAGCGGEASKTVSASRGGPAVTVLAKDLTFEPREVRVAAEKPVVLRLKNEGKLLHDWTIEQIPATSVQTRGSDSHPMDAHGGAGAAMMTSGMMGDNTVSGALHVAAEAGHTAEVTFTPTQSGEFVFYCSVPGHRQAGMEGRLVVQ